MRQNRVNPLGEIITAKERGAWLGNRGVIHNSSAQIIKPFKHKSWITCLLDFKNRKFEIMAPNRWTQLFFMDEATAFSAGHRPCAECRRADFKEFKTSWINGNPQYGFTTKISINEIDSIIHSERINKEGQKITYLDFSNHLPDGIFVFYKNEPYLIYNGLLHLWSAAGYISQIPLPLNLQFEVLTPRSLVNTIKAGYKPQVNLFNV